MGYDRTFAKLTLTHTVHLTDEIAQTHIAFADVTNGAPNPGSSLVALMDSTALAAIATSWETFVLGSNRRFASYSRLAQIKVAHIGRSGAYEGHDPAIASYAGTYGSDTTIPPQVCSVASLRTAKTTGRRGRAARMYLPHLAALMESGSAFGTAVSCQAIADGLRTFLNDVADNTPFTSLAMEPVLMSKLPTTPGADADGETDDCRAIVSVYVGNILDGQQSRRVNLAETYYHHDL